jgi:hypothetical protein
MKPASAVRIKTVLVCSRPSTSPDYFLFSVFVAPSKLPTSTAALIFASLNNKRRSQWPRGLSHELSSPAPTLRSWVRIPLRHGCLCVFCVRFF